jgi:hypothetical protein
MIADHLDFPQQHHGYQVHDDIVDDHKDRVEVEECHQVDALYIGVLLPMPDTVQGHTLHQSDNDGADAERRGEDLHQVDEPSLDTRL